MNTASPVVVRKDYLNRNLTPRNVDTGIKPKPVWLQILFVMFVSMAAFGEWKTINAAVGGLPKAVTLGVIGLAFVYCVVCADLKTLKKVGVPYFMYLLLIILIMGWSIVIWIMNFTDMSSMVRGGEKMAYQLISVTVAVCAVYLFGRTSIKLFFISICIGNGAIMAMESLTYGIGNSIQSLTHSILTFGDAEGFTRAIEIHELTFLFGQFMIYYAVFAPANNAKEKKERILGFIFATFFFLAGMKRIAVLAVAMAILLGFVLKRLKKAGKVSIIIGIGFFIFYFLFLKWVRDGAFAAVMTKLGIDMMGRNYIWSLTKSYYRLSPTFMGLGFEAVDAISKSWYNDGLLQAAFMFHNDILKVFVELGFPGFCLWSVVQYVVYPIYFSKAFDNKTAALYMSVLFYMSITYMTDNTAFYFWCTMGLRLIPLAYGFGLRLAKKEQKWSPPTPEVMRQKMQDYIDFNR